MRRPLRDFRSKLVMAALLPGLLVVFSAARAFARDVFEGVTFRYTVAGQGRFEYVDEAENAVKIGGAGGRTSGFYFPSVRYYDYMRGALALWVRLDWDGDAVDETVRTLVAGDYHGRGQMQLYHKSGRLVFAHAMLKLGRWDESPAVDVSGWKAGEWHHVAVSWDGSKKRLFVDGELVGEHEARYGFSGDISEITLGQDARFTGPALLEGWVADFTVWARPLSEEDVKQLHSLGRCGEIAACLTRAKEVGTERHKGPPPDLLQGATLYVSFDGTAAADFAAGLGHPIAGDGYRFVDGVLGKAISVSSHGGPVVGYSAGDGTFGRVIDPSEGTLAFWVQTIDWSFNSNGLERELVAVAPYVGATSFFTVTAERGGITFDHRGRSGWSLGPKAEIRGDSRGRWHHVVVTWSASEGMKRLYVDGEPVGALASDFLQSWPAGSALVVGGSPFLRPSNVVVDELIIWPRPLGAGEVRRLFEGYREVPAR